MKIIHFCAGLEQNNGMANTARQFVAEERARGDESQLTNELGKIVRGVDRVVIHGAWLPVLWKVAKRARQEGAELVIRPAGSYDPVRLGYHGWKKRLVGWWERRMLRRADVLLATCEAERRWILNYEPRVKKVEVTDLKRFFDLAAAGSRSRTRDGVALNLLYLGRRHPLKGVEYLEKAVAELKGNPLCGCDSGLRLKCVSDHFGEELERDWDWCDVLVLPTLSENFGRVVAEALERGKRVIVTDGAPAWETREMLDCGNVGVGYGGRLVYLRGFREGTEKKRVELLKKGIEGLTRGV